MAEKESVTERVKGCIIQALELDLSTDELADDESLFDGGLGMDSMATLQIVAAVEEEFGFEVPDEDLTPELLESVRTLADYAVRSSSSSISSARGMPSQPMRGSSGLSLRAESKAPG